MTDDSYAIRSKKVVFRDECRPATLVIAHGKIEHVLDYDAPEAAQDMGELAISPGVVDPHVHINDPGRTEWETFAAATKAAVSGGSDHAGGHASQLSARNHDCRCTRRKNRRC